jgi:general stress protein YciG
MDEKPKRGFALLSPEQRRAISIAGGKASVDRHKYTPETAAKAGRIGGKAKHPNKGFGSKQPKREQND